MTREEAIGYNKNLREYMRITDKYNPECKFLNENHEALDMAIKALEQTRWIPVGERLPEDGQKVLVTTQNGNIINIDTCLFYHASAYWKHYVIAWMPLPESYNKENKTKQGLVYADQDTLMPAT